MELEGKVAIVTGASRGIGKGIAQVLAKRGMQVVVAARSETDTPTSPGTIHQTVAEIQQEGGKAVPLKVDLARDEEIKHMVDWTVGRLGRLDVLVNNSVTLGRIRSFTEMEIENWDYVMRVNFRGPLLACKLALGPMLKQGAGAIVNLTSGAALVDREQTPGVPMPYGVSKAALDRLTYGMALDLAKENIAFITLDPGFTYTERLAIRGHHVGLDASQAQPMDYPGRVVDYILTHDPKSFSGQRVYVPEFVAKHGLG